jgi:hypothetical protein
MVVQPSHAPASRASKRGSQAHLFLDGKHVGVELVLGFQQFLRRGAAQSLRFTVDVKGWMAPSWGYGDFTPNGGFSDYAPLFGLWSLLMHADGETERLSRAAAQELLEAEHKLDAIKARLFFPHAPEWVDVAELTIDGALLEWKQY